MKNSENNKLDQLLKNKLAEGSANVPDFVWDNIEAELFPEKKRRGFFWWFFGGVCGMLFIGIAVFFSNESAKSQTVNRSPKQYTDHQITAQPAADSNIHIYPKLNTSTKRAHQTNTPENPIYPSKKSAVSLKWNTTKPTHSSQKSSRSYTKAQLHPSKAGKNNPAGSIPSEAKTVSAPNHLQEMIGKSATVSGSPKNTSSNNGKSATIDTTMKISKTEEVANRLDTVPFEQIIRMLKNRFTTENSGENSPSPSRFSIGIYGGPSLYDIAVFKDYFTSGQLSRRTFSSSGFEAGFNARFNLGNRFTIYSGLAFNQKQTQFTYNVAITESDYFTNLANGNKIPIANIVDNGVNSCFLAKGVTAKYSVSSALFSMGTTFEFWKSGRFSAAADLRFSCNIQSAMKLSEMTILDIQQPKSERFTYFQPGLGVTMNVQLNKRISVGLAPMFSKQLYWKESFARKVNELVVPVVIRIGI